MTGFQNDAAVIQSAAKHVRDVRDSVSSQLSALGGTVNEIGTHWKGDAAGAFHHLMQRWNTDSKALQHALSDIADQLEKSGTTYTATDTDQSESMNRIASALG